MQSSGALRRGNASARPDDRLREAIGSLAALWIASSLRSSQ